MANRFSRTAFFILVSFGLSPGLSEAAMKYSSGTVVSPDASNQIYNAQSQGQSRNQNNTNAPSRPTRQPACIWRQNADGTRTRLCGVQKNMW